MRKISISPRMVSCFSTSPGSQMQKQAAGLADQALYFERLVVLVMVMWPSMKR